MTNEPKTSHILGIDYGKAKVGLAIADNETRLAFGYGTIENNKELFKKIAEIIEKEGVVKVIVGNPCHPELVSGSQEILMGCRNRSRIKSGMTSYEDFAYTLKNLVPNIEVEFTNEMFTTKMAQDNLKEKGMKNIQRLDDQEAARIILQGWLDSTVNKNQELVNGDR